MSRLSFMTISSYLDLVNKCREETGSFSLKEEYGSIYEDILEAGYGFVDLSSWEADSIGLKCLLLLLQKYGLKVSSYIHFEDFAELEKDLQAGIRRACSGVDKAAVLGSEFLMIGIQDRGNIKETDPAKIRERLITYFQNICAYADDKKVLPVIENIPDAGLSLSRWRDVRAVMDSVPSLGYIFDSGTLLVAEENSSDYLTALKDRLVYVHLKDMTETDGGTAKAVFPSVSGKLLMDAPIGKGLVDMEKVLDQLKEAGYAGRMAVEFCKDEEGTRLDSMKRSRRYIEERL